MTRSASFPTCARAHAPAHVGGAHARRGGRRQGLWEAWHGPAAQRAGRRPAAQREASSHAALGDGASALSALVLGPCGGLVPCGGLLPPSGRVPAVRHMPSLRSEATM
eukprot:4203063-Prymnesium_polylepis.2